MKYQAYPEYEEFSSASLDKCPKGWRNVSVKHCFNIQLGKMLQTKPESTNDVEIQYLKAQHVNWDGVNVESLPLMWASPNGLEKYSVNNGDLLVCEGGDVGRASILDSLEEQAIIQNALHRVRNDVLGEVRFFRYMLRHLHSIGWFDVLCNKATIAHLTGEKLAAIKIPLPSKDEQEKIAAFLDYKTQQIDQLIEKKKSLIEKLNEQRIAVITQAVTKGLNKNAEMKPSGVDWLGDVPEHWGVVKLRFLLSQNLTNGIFKKAVDWGSGCRVVNVFDVYVHNDIVNELSLDRLVCDDDEKEKYSAKHGDLFLVRSSLKTEGVGKSVSVIDPIEDMVFECHLVRGRPDLEKVNPRYINLFLNSKYARDYFVSRANVVTMATIDQSKFKDIVVSLPNYDEQEKIAKLVDKKLLHIDGMVNAAKEVVEKINEYRTSLITAAVTGKIDVRNIEIGEVA